MGAAVHAQAAMGAPLPLSVVEAATPGSSGGRGSGACRGGVEALLGDSEELSSDRGSHTALLSFLDESEVHGSGSGGSGSGREGSRGLSMGGSVEDSIFDSGVVAAEKVRANDRWKHVDENVDEERSIGERGAQHGQDVELVAEDDDEASDVESRSAGEAHETSSGIKQIIGLADSVRNELAKTVHVEGVVRVLSSSIGLLLEADPRGADLRMHVLKVGHHSTQNLRKRVPRLRLVTPKA